MSGNEGRTRCEVYSRVVGFLSPVSQWNKGKKAEWVDRTTWDGAGGVVNKSLTTAEESSGVGAKNEGA
jgi:ribonucleoside-triphosphate reductase